MIPCSIDSFIRSERDFALCRAMSRLSIGRLSVIVRKNHTVFTPGDHLSSRVLSPFYFNGVLYANLQHYFLHAKALLFKDYHHAALILAALDMGEREVLGSDIRNFDETLWLSRREAIMLDGCREKFIQNRPHREVLFKTGDTVLVYATEYDPVWGAGIGSEDDRVCEPAQWMGKNLLGYILMQVRNDLRDNPEVYRPGRVSRHRRSPYRMLHARHGSNYIPRPLAESVE